MFNLIGLSDRAGSGFPKIKRAWKELHWRNPLLQEEVKPEKTILRLTMLSLFPQEIMDKLTQRFGEKFNRLKEIERLAVVTATIDGSVNNQHLCSISTEHARDLTTMLGKLVKEGFLTPDGRGRGTSYQLSDTAKTTSEDINYILNRFGEDAERLLKIAEPIRNKSKSTAEEVKNAILQLCISRFLSAKDIAIILNRSTVNDSLQKLIRSDKLELQYKESRRHINQAYKTIT
jgi:ATP-dependent DNA helicase RecG